MTVRPAAFFDVDGTLVRGNVVSYYARMRTAEMGSLRRWIWILSFLPKALVYWLVDKFSRRHFHLLFHRNYRGFRPSLLEEAGRRHAERFLLPRVFSGGLKRIRYHRERDHLVVLVSGSIEPVVKPLADALEADELVCAKLEVVDDRMSGDLDGGPVADRVKADAVRRIAARDAIDLSISYAYADSLDDLPMLETVGKPAVVNPGRRLKSLARRRGWDIYHWRVE